jgi:hypothetical protein
VPVAAVNKDDKALLSERKVRTYDAASLTSERGIIFRNGLRERKGDMAPPAGDAGFPHRRYQGLFRTLVPFATYRRHNF